MYPITLRETTLSGRLSTQNLRVGENPLLSLTALKRKISFVARIVNWLHRPKTDAIGRREA
jgi:hypothetical protein